MSEQPTLPLSEAPQFAGARRAIAPRSRPPQRFRYLVHREGHGWAFTNRVDADQLVYGEPGVFSKDGWVYEDRGRFR